MKLSISHLLALCAAGLVTTSIFLTILMQSQISVLDTVRCNSEQLSKALESGQKLRYESAQIQNFYTDVSLTQDRVPMDEAQQHSVASLQLRDELETIVKSLSSRTQALRVSFEQLNSSGKLMVVAYARNKAEGDTVMDDFDQRSAKVISELSKLSEPLDNLQAAIGRQPSRARISSGNPLHCMRQGTGSLAWSVAIDCQ